MARVGNYFATLFRESENVIQPALSHELLWFIAIFSPQLQIDPEMELMQLFHFLTLMLHALLSLMFAITLVLALRIRLIRCLHLSVVKSVMH